MSTVFISQKQSQLQELFAKIDESKNGFLDFDEFKKGMRNDKNFKDLSDKDLKIIFDRCDINGDGNLDYSEFVFGASGTQVIKDTYIEHTFKAIDKD